MIQTKQALKIIETALALSTAPETEVTVLSQTSQDMRYATNRVIQHQTVTDCQVFIRVVDQGRIGVCSTTGLDESTLAWAIDIAKTGATLQTVISDYHLPQIDPALCSPEQVPISPVGEYQLDPVLEYLSQRGYHGAGSLRTEDRVIAIGNSRGNSRFHSAYCSGFTCIASRGEYSGYAGDWRNSFKSEELLQVGEEAIRWAEGSDKLYTIQPGDYSVVLSPYATADLIWLLQHMGFSAKSFLEERSFMNDRIGQNIMAPEITIYDDATDRRGFPWEFDWEGVTRQKVYFIKQGIAQDVVYDSWTGMKSGRNSTGHAIPAIYFGQGPSPGHIVMQQGATSEGELIKSVKKGIYINRFHYTNVVDPREAVATGMTRDGTYLIENGHLTARIKNLRFTESLLRAFGSEVIVGNNARLIVDGDVGIIVPSLKLATLRFTS